jgi:hypothetical protein
MGGHLYKKTKKWNFLLDFRDFMVHFYSKSVKESG